jgi:pimeloyl-ACP methyl ester carboxylesterase
VTTSVETDGGLRANVAGAPSQAELPLSTQLMVAGSVAFDLVLRTALASAVSAPVVLWAIRDKRRAQLEHLRRYRELAQTHDPAIVFPAPASTPVVTELPAPRFSFKAPGGRVRMLRFESPFEALNPHVRAEYASFSENRIAWAQHWRHDDGPRPTLAVIHGFGASPYWLNSLFFSLPWFYGLGYDVFLYLLPFHGVRQARSAFSGWGLFAHGPAHLSEAIAHAVHDFRVFVDYLESNGVQQVALTGLSLGGYVASLLAAVDERLALVIPNAPVARIVPLAKQWFPINLLLTGGARIWQLDDDALDATLAVHCPLNYVPLIPHERLMIIGGLGDRLAPPAQALMLWEHWNHPRLHWFPGNHILHAGRGMYLKEMLAFMHAAGFRPE